MLGFVLLVLLLSSLDHRGDKMSLRTTKQKDQVQITQSDEKKAEVVRTGLFTDVHVPPRQREVWLGDLDGMLERGQLRVLITFSRTFFFQANDQELGLNTEILRLYEQFLNDQVILGENKMKFIFLPTPQERLLEDLVAGKGDIAVADIQLIPNQEKQIQLTSPVTMDIQEILVTGPNSPQFKSIFNLSGKTITIRKNSPYAASLQKLNNTLTSIGRKPVTIRFADAFLDDEDLLEMTAAGLLPMTVVDSHLAEFWSHVFHNLKLHNKIALRPAKEITWAIRADAHLLQESISYFKETSYLPQDGHRVLTEYYRKKGGFLKNNLRLSALERYHNTVDLFEEYGEKYNFPSLLLAALAYQESELDTSWLGDTGEVGLMGVNPSGLIQEGLEADLKRLRKPEKNIETATHYLRFLIDHYFSSPKTTELNQNLMAIAAYKTSPEQVMAARKRAALAGYDPDIWFNHVETAMQQEEGNDIAQYIRNAYNYFQAYTYFLALPEERHQGERQ